MHRSITNVVHAASLALALAACSSTSSSNGALEGDGGSVPAGNQEPPAMNGMTAAHNVARDAVAPPAASPIPHLTWDDAIANVAQAHASQCVFQHSGGAYGENIYATSGSTTPEDVVKSWISEASSYDYATNACSSVCGHYTQVVWAKSARLGCGVSSCTSGSPFGGGAWQMWVCDYDPPGNLVGERPY